MSNVRTCKDCNFDFFDNSNFDSAAGMCGPCSRRAKCPVFGCTIPRGIPHEHPAGVSVVMRDPGAPLTDIERAELQYHRQLAVINNQSLLNRMLGNSAEDDTATGQALYERNKAEASIICNELAAQVMAQSQIDREMRDAGVHVIRDAPMIPGRKLRDSLMLAGMMPRAPRPEIDSGVHAALLEAGRPRREGLEQKLIAAGLGYPMSKEDAVKAYTAKLAPRTDSISNEDCEWCYGAGHDPYGDPCVGCCELKPVKPRRSFVSTTARVAFWIVLAVTVAIWIFAGVKS